MFEWLDIKIRSKRVKKEGKNKRTRNHKRSFKIGIAHKIFSLHFKICTSFFLREGSVYNAVH